MINITITKDGPYLISSPTEDEPITIFHLLEDKTEVEKKVGLVALCACGKSNNKPFCDGSHKS